jgi:hypothetical protein
VHSTILFHVSILNSATSCNTTAINQHRCICVINEELYSLKMLITAVSLLNHTDWNRPLLHCRWLLVKIADSDTDFEVSSSLTLKLNFQLRLRCACTAMREGCDFIVEQSQTNFQLRLRCACKAAMALR